EGKPDAVAKFLELFEKKLGAATVLKDPTGFDFSLAIFQAALGHSNLNRPRLDFLVRLLDKHAAETEFVEITFLRRLQALSGGKGNSSVALTAREMQQALRLGEAA